MSELPQRFPLKILAIFDELAAHTAIGRASRALGAHLREQDYKVILAESSEDGMSVIASDPLVGCLLLDWDLNYDDAVTHRQAIDVLRSFRARHDRAPVFLVGERSQASAVALEVLQLADDFIWILEDTPNFICGRIEAAMKRYADQLLPPMFKALLNYDGLFAYAWCTPGHTGGTAFLKTPVSHMFFDFFGENLLRTDLSISMGELGSLLDHSGPIGEGEKYAARVFGAHRTYTVTNGSSTSNRVIFGASVTDGDIALCDRNCHKSIEQSMTQTGAIPVYMTPHRNRYGIIGPIYAGALTPAALQASIAAHPLRSLANSDQPRHLIITNSTYDGLTYDVTRVVELVGDFVDRLHFDEAWYGYARFNPLYANRFAMYGDPRDYTSGPTIIATQSTHKLLAALSQASFIHVRDGRDPIEHGRFNESFMMHASTSPQYAIIASNDVTAAMMDGAQGVALTTETIREAVTFRQTMGRLRKELARDGQWFFATWNPDTVINPIDGQRVAFEEANEQLLIHNPNCWVLHPGATWHGFDGIEEGYCMLDPIKVTVLTPGIAADGSFEKLGIPAALVTAYLDAKGIIVEKTQDFSMLFLFSIGITKGKWGSLLMTLLDFKHDYDTNAPLAEVLPDLVASTGGRYAGMGLRDLAAEMFDQYHQSNQMNTLEAAFSTLPRVEMTPRAAYHRLVRNEVEHVTLEQAANRIAATGIVPYPPGIPMVMPGECIGDEAAPYLGYLKALRAWDRRFPGFGHDTHGVEVEDGEYYLYCLK